MFPTVATVAVALVATWTAAKVNSDEGTSLAGKLNFHGFRLTPQETKFPVKYVLLLTK